MVDIPVEKLGKRLGLQIASISLVALGASGLGVFIWDRTLLAPYQPGQVLSVSGAALALGVACAFAFFRPAATHAKRDKSEMRKPFVPPGGDEKWS